MADKVQKSTVQLIIDGQTSKVSLKELGGAVKQLKQELRGMKEADDPVAWQKKTQEIKAANLAYGEAKDRIRDLTSEAKKLQSSWKDVFKGFLGGTAVTYALEQLMNAATAVQDKIYDMSDSLTDVGKQTNKSSKEVREFNKDLTDINTRTFAKELRDISIVAGKNGIQKDLSGAVKSLDMVNVAFGDEFESVTEVTESLINLRKIFTDVQSENVGDDVLHIGNAMNYLADAGTASGKVMVDFSSRMGGVLIPLGATTGQILGMATTMEELSITAERGSTAVTTIFQKMLTNVDDFAKVAGMKSKDFALLLNTDIFGAFQKFMAGAKAGGSQATQFAKILSDVELTGSGTSETIMKLASNEQMLSKYVSEATEKLKETSAITTEFTKKNENAAAIIDKLRKVADNAFERLAMWGMDLVEAYGPWLLSLTNISSTITDQRGLWQTLGTALLIYYANTIRATVATAANTTAQIANKIVVAASIPLYSLAGTGLRLMTIGHQLLTGQITLSTAATRVAAMATKSLNAIWMANPLGVVIAGLSLAVGALKLYSDNTREALELEKKKHKLSVELAKSTSDNEKAQAMLNERIADYNSASDIEQKNLRNEVILRKQKLAAQLKNIEAQRVELSQQAAAPSLFQKFVGIMKGVATGGPNAGGAYAMEMAGAAADNMQKVNEQFDDQIKTLKESLSKYDAMGRQMDRMDKSDAEIKKNQEGAKTAGYLKGKPKKEKKKKEDTLFSDRAEWEMAEDKYDQARRDESKGYSDAEDKYDQKQKDDSKSYQDAENAYDLDQAEKEAADNFNKTKNGLGMGEATGQITPEAANRAKLDAEEAYLAELYLLRQSYGQDTSDLEQQLAELSIDRAAQVTTADKKNVEMQRELAVELQTAKADALEQGAAALRGFFKETSLIYKGLFIVEKAAAIANVIIKSQAEMAAVSAYAATMGPFGVAYEAAMLAKSKIRTGISVATIAAQAVQSFVPGREEGGYTDIGSLQKSSNPGGYVRQPTFFDLGARSYIAGEKYKPEYVVPSKMLQDPYFAAKAAEMEHFRTTGQHPMSTAASGGSAGGSGSTDALLIAHINETKLLRQALEGGRIKIVFNTAELQRHQDYIDFIHSETSI